MKEASNAILKQIGSTRSAGTGDPQQTVRFQVSIVCQAFADLQQARHRADYDIAAAFNALDAAVSVAQARLAFEYWTKVRDEPLAQEYLYCLLFKDTA